MNKNSPILHTNPMKPNNIPSKSNRHILGLGNDIIEISRVQKGIERQGVAFLKRILTTAEIDYCQQFQDSAPHVAGRFVAKEAVVKALGTGFGKAVHWHDIEILNDEWGKPIVKLSARLSERLNQPQLLVSISHCKEYATAIAIWSSG